MSCDHIEYITFEPDATPKLPSGVLPLSFFDLRHEVQHEGSASLMSGAH